MSEFSGSPSIVVLGTGSNKKAKGLIENIDKSNIPGDYLSSVCVTLENGERYKISKKMFTGIVQYDTIHDQFKSMDFFHKLNTIEIIIDSDKVYEDIEKKANEFLSQYFK